MQEPTHILTGVILQKAFAGVKPSALALTLTAATAFLSHGFLDELAVITFHPADPDFHSAFWVGYHSFLLICTVAFLWRWWRPYKWGIFWACLPDLDWVFIHGQQIFHVQIPFYRQPHLHNVLHIIYHQVPPFTWVTAAIQHLPNNRHNPWGVLWEVLLVSLLLLVFKLMKMSSYQPKNLAPPDRRIF